MIDIDAIRKRANDDWAVTPTGVLVNDIDALCDEVERLQAAVIRLTRERNNARIGMSEDDEVCMDCGAPATVGIQDKPPVLRCFCDACLDKRARA